MKNLTVYRASAGSGKTFTLAVEYIKLLIENPAAYKQTLAVTFTNKATEEMKMRILSKLYGIARGLPDSKDYLKKIIESSTLSEAQIKDRASKALSMLIHNYNYFRVETIDAFFQTVLRNLARELDLTANLRIELNDSEVEQKAVDELVEGLDDTSLLLYWILEYINENIDDDKSWNVIGQIKKFGENIFKDYYKDNRRQLSEILNKKGFFKNFKSELSNIKKLAKEQMTEFAESFFDLLNENGLSENDFSNKSKGPCGYFIKLRKGDFLDGDNIYNKTAQAAALSPEKWVNKSKQKFGDPAYDLAANNLCRMLSDTETIRQRQARLYNSAELTLHNLNQLRLLGSIGDKVTEINQELNRFMLSDTQTLLSAMISDNDSPFVFEKIGAQLQHIMIDEFQDTSTVQWHNFKVLLLDTMSHAVCHDENDGNVNNLIVGDVKQSIYRWRSGDWRLLNNIDEEFSSNMLDDKSLKVNYRSDANIIRFNNSFFANAAVIEKETAEEVCGPEAAQLEKAYADVCQDIPESKINDNIGNIEISLIPNEDYQNNMLQMTADKVSYLIQHGICLNQIAIIVRNNRTIQNIGEYFMDVMPEVKLISDEAFRLDSSQAVNIIVNTMRILVNPDDKISIAALKKMYGSLPTAFTDNIEQIMSMPIMDMAEKIYSIFKLEKFDTQAAYVCKFYDILSEYLADGIPDIADFLEQWDNTLYKKTIQSSSTDGIRLITIHKSKGLEFDYVIMPFCDWALEQRGNIWCKSNESPYNKLPIVPISFEKKKMLNSVYAADYQHEHLQNVVDNLNLLYVAFTRAGKGLYVYGKCNEKPNSRSALLEQCMPIVAKKLDVDFCQNDDGSMSFSFGPEPTTSTVKEHHSENIFETVPNSIDVLVESFASHVEFRQSNKSRDFIYDGIEDEDRLQRNSYINAGNVLHQLFSSIKTSDDIPAALQQLQQDGILYDDNITVDKMNSMLHKRLHNSQVAEWFSAHWNIFNECSILKVNPETGKVEERRPDRVMSDGKEMIVVDFKFGRQRKEYIDQVKEYMQLLTDMGYTNISGYLWYVYSDKIVKV